MKTNSSTPVENASSSSASTNLGSDLKMRDRYLLEAQRIRDEIGDLDLILETLGLNQRKACQLLLVDPSAWTRWRKTGAPPHIYQALRWLIQLKKVNPEVVGPTDIASRIDHIQHSTQKKLKELETNLSMVERALTYAPSTQSHDSSAIEFALAQQEKRFQQTIDALKQKVDELSVVKAAPKKARSNKAGNQSGKPSKARNGGKKQVSKPGLRAKSKKKSATQKKLRSARMAAAKRMKPAKKMSLARTNARKKAKAKSTRVSKKSTIRMKRRGR